METVHREGKKGLMGVLTMYGRSWYQLLSNRRKFERLPLSGAVTLTLQGSALLTDYICSCVDISPRGLGLYCPESIAPNSVVRLQSEELASSRYARVIHCEDRGGGFRVGLEFVTIEGLSAELAAAHSAGASR